MPRRPLMVRAALLRRSCDGVAAATELRRPAPSRSFCASRSRRSWCCCDGADAARSAAATELRRSCDGVAAATESLLWRSSADQLRRAHSARRVLRGQGGGL